MIGECINLYLQTHLEHRFSHICEISCGRDSEINHTSSYHARHHPQPPDLGKLTCNLPSSSRASPLPPPRSPSLNTANNLPDQPQQYTTEPPQFIFRPLEDYIVACFSSIECLNTSFSTFRAPHLLRAASEGAVIERCTALRCEDGFASGTHFPDLDAKTLLLGDFAENGSWWTGKSHVEQRRAQIYASRVSEGDPEERVNLKSPRINWTELNDWYHAVISIRHSWRAKLKALQDSNFLGKNRMNMSAPLPPDLLQHIDDNVGEACKHVQRALLKASENILRRPGRPLRSPEDCRFLLVLMANPLLYGSNVGNTTRLTFTKSQRSASHGQAYSPRPPLMFSRQPTISSRQFPSTRYGTSGKYLGIIKRILGLMSNLPSECHRYLVSWFSRFSEAQFRKLVDLVGGFVTHRLSRQHGRKHSTSHDPHGGLIPNIYGAGVGSSAQLHATLGVSGSPKSSAKGEPGVSYGEDWQIKAAAKVMSLLFSANIQDPSRKYDLTDASHAEVGSSRTGSVAARNLAHRHGQLLPTSAFYNSLLDYSDLIADFEAWESRRGRFSFCQYPMFLSIWAKIRIMEHDARRQMEIKAREAFFNSIMSRKAINQYLVLKVRRECLVEDSLRSVSEVVGAGQEEVKKGLRIEFMGEEGLDSGGLRKEWFLLLVREVFDPEHGLFVYDEDSHYCYFNPGTFETSDQFFLVGVVIGLAIYNSTILDVALPPFAFRKLLASAPNYTGPVTSTSRPTVGYALEDLAEFRPSLAQGLKQLLDFEGDVEETFCRDFIIIVERYGQPVEVPLCPSGEKRSVTNSNRYEFVDLYIRYLLDTSVARQYEPFKRGFFTVCGGNALSLFRPEEIELLVRGSDEPLDVATLRNVAIYDGWGKGIDGGDAPVVTWFWDTFGKASAKDQRKLLGFITSSDRIPAMGTTSLVIKITCLGDHSNRFPIARTCFNMLGLYRYRDRMTLEDKLWRAVIDSEGFGMK